METDTRQFHIGDVLSITTGRLVSPKDIDGVRNILDYMTGTTLMTAELPKASRKCKPYLLKQFPQLESGEMQFAFGELVLSLEKASDNEKKYVILGWLLKLVSGVYGVKVDEMMGVKPLPPARRNIPEYQKECVKCGEFDYFYRMKDDVCIFCQPCANCGGEETEKVFVSWGSIGQERGYVCLECADILDPDRYK